MSRWQQHSYMLIIPTNRPSSAGWGPSIIVNGGWKTRGKKAATFNPLWPIQPTVEVVMDEVERNCLKRKIDRQKQSQRLDDPARRMFEPSGGADSEHFRAVAENVIGQFTM